MNAYSLRFEIKDGEVETILKELYAAQETIMKCYRQLVEIGVVSIKKDATSGN